MPERDGLGTPEHIEPDFNSKAQADFHYAVTKAAMLFRAEVLALGERYLVEKEAEDA